MVDCYIGEIRLWAGARAPKGWAFCQGQLMAISEYNVLYSLIGTTYGGDGHTTFALPDLRGRVPVSQGQGTGLSNRALGSTGGQENVALTSTAQLPAHTHTLYASTATATDTNPANLCLGTPTSSGVFYGTEAISGSVSQVLKSDTLTSVGEGATHSNLMPVLALNYIIMLKDGYYPSFQ